MEESCQWQALVALPPNKARYTNLLRGCWTTESIENPMTNINFLSSIHLSASLVFLSHLLYLCILSFFVSPFFFPFLHVELFSQISLTTWRYSRKATQYGYQQCYLPTALFQCSPRGPWKQHSFMQSGFYNSIGTREKQLRWSRGSVLAFRTQVCGFKPGRSRRIFRAKKILSTPSFGGEVKPSVPCRFAACKRSLNLRGSRNLGKITTGSLSRPQFHLSLLGSLASLRTEAPGG